MLREEFETWPADSLPDTTLVTIGKHLIKLGYLEDRSPRFTKQPKGNTEESNKMLIGLDIAIVIRKANDQDLLDLIDLEGERADKKKEKVEKCQ